MMTEEERTVLARIELAVGEQAAVGEVELCRRIWPMETEVALGKPGGARSVEMLTMRRRVRKIIFELRVGWRSAILDTSHGYFFASDSVEVEQFCRRRHKRSMTGLYIESIVRKGQPLDIGVQMFMEFLFSHEDAARKAARRRGIAFKPTNPADVVAAVAEQAKTLQG